MNEALTGATSVIAINLGLNMVGTKSIAEPIKTGLKTNIVKLI